jgi:lysophospholipid acyltransferase (LPLAT)-like uncharacterized protein
MGVEKRNKWWTSLAGGGIGALMQLIGRTLDIRTNRDERDDSYDCPAIYAMWHNRTFMPFYLWTLTGFERRMHAFTSASKDGAIIEAIAASFGMGSVRGSSHRRGATAMLETLTVLRKNGNCIAITPDGPHGPLYKVQQGVVALASMSGLPVIPVCIEFEDCWRLRKTWDAYCIPKPFSRVNVQWRKKIYVPSALTHEQFQEYVDLIQEQLSSGTPDLPSISSCN